MGSYSSFPAIQRGFYDEIEKIAGDSFFDKLKTVLPSKDRLTGMLPSPAMVGLYAALIGVPAATTYGIIQSHRNWQNERAQQIQAESRIENNNQPIKMALRELQSRDSSLKPEYMTRYSRPYQHLGQFSDPEFVTEATGRTHRAGDLLQNMRKASMKKTLTDLAILLAEQAKKRSRNK